MKSAPVGVSPAIGIEFYVLTERIKESLLRERLMATLSGAFGLLAGLLATFGLYGVRPTWCRGGGTKSACAWLWARAAGA